MKDTNIEQVRSGLRVDHRAQRHGTDPPGQADVDTGGAVTGRCSGTASDRWMQVRHHGNQIMPVRVCRTRLSAGQPSLGAPRIRAMLSANTTTAASAQPSRMSIT